MAKPALLLVLIIALTGMGHAALSPSDADPYIDAVRVYADKVLAHGRDTYGPMHTPMFVDGLNVNTLEPVIWKKDGEEWILSNMASQQNLFRILDGLSNLTGERKYRGAAVRAVRYTFDNLRSPNGLIYWGGHYAWDAGGDRLVREQDSHELKRHYPYYEFMWRVDPEATKKYLEAFWRAHMTNWDNLDMNRHGRYNKPTDMPWPEKYVGGEVFFVSGEDNLSFVNTGSDLYYAGAVLHKLSGEEMPRIWAERLAHRYVETRNPKTGLGGYQYSRIKADRAEVQFGDVERLKGHLVLEGTILTSSTARTRYGIAGITQLKLGEMLGKNGANYTRWALEDLSAYAKHAYNPEDNTFAALLTDGTRLSRDDMQKDGYYGTAGSGKLDPHKADSLYFWAYALASRVSGDPAMWEMVRDIGRHEGLGDIGESPRAQPRLDMNTDFSDPQTLLGCLELHRQTGRAEFLDMAKRIGDNIIDQRVRNGFFVRSRRHVYTKFDCMEPLALLTLAASIRGEPDAVPDAWPGESFFQCPFDGKGRTTDNSAIYGQREE